MEQPIFSINVCGTLSRFVQILLNYVSRLMPAQRFYGRAIVQEYTKTE